MIKAIKEQFAKIFDAGGSEKAYFAPGRVNLIGEYTDIAGGYVFPCAITLGTYAVCRKRNDDLLMFYSMNFEEHGIIKSSLKGLRYDASDSWANYPKGVIWALQEKGYKIETGLDILYSGNLPHASGLSSSASIEVLTAFILNDLFDFNISLTDMAIFTRYSENKFINVNCGIMDQFSIAMGKRDNAIFLNTADLSYEYTPVLFDDMKIVIMNSNKRRGLTDSKYNERREECDKALVDLQSEINIKSLCELTEEQFEIHKSAIKNPIYRKRARHIIYENGRTVKAVEALKQKDIGLFGRLMTESHTSLSEDFEVSGIELDTLVRESLNQEGVIGARMTGAGFGGCAVAIVSSGSISCLTQNVGRVYRSRFGYEPDFYIVEAGNGPIVI